MKNSRVPIIVNLSPELERVEILLAADVHTGSAEFDEMK
jgi:DNA polymerase II small subunit/DNA polymerase delta subunit B